MRYVRTFFINIHCLLTKNEYLSDETEFERNGLLVSTAGIHIVADKKNEFKNLCKFRTLFHLFESSSCGNYVL